MQTSYTTRPEWSGWGYSNPPACAFGERCSCSLSYIRVWHRPQGSNLQPARSKRAALNPLEPGRHSAVRPLSAVVQRAVRPDGTAPASRMLASGGTPRGYQTRRPRPSQRRALFTELEGHVMCSWPLAGRPPASAAAITPQGCGRAGFPSLAPRERPRTLAPGEGFEPPRRG